MTIPYDHTAILEDIWTQFQNSPNVRAILEKFFVAPANQGEDLLELATKHNVVDGFGLMLDDIGAMLDVTREKLGGLSDADYIIALIVRARSSISAGTLEDFAQLLRAILASHPPIPIVEWFPAAVRVYLIGITPSQGTLLEVLLKGVLPAAGVNTVLSVHDDTCISFNSSHGPVTQTGWFGSSHGPATLEAGWCHAIKL
ncbi:MAG TPA: hypothetical protein P5234_14335 [Thermoanaerobaculaceae bacterium]|nr:hypothetical protein [Thermoanaerobaculaceae bacterium]HRU10224.1 hypothetical protein [Thermoanaerobaculia bacterium]